LITFSLCRRAFTTPPSHSISLSFSSAFFASFSVANKTNHVFSTSFFKALTSGHPSHENNFCFNSSSGVLLLTSRRMIVVLSTWMLGRTLLWSSLRARVGWSMRAATRRGGEGGREAREGREERMESGMNICGFICETRKPPSDCR